MFYSLVGPEGAEFKINELEMEVCVRNVSKTETITLTSEAREYKGPRFGQDTTIDAKEFSMATSKLASIEGLVKWKATAWGEATSGAKLTLQLYKAGENRPTAELDLAKYPRDASSEGYTTTPIDFPCENYSNENVFQPRQKGWPGIFSENDSLFVPPL